MGWVAYLCQFASGEFPRPKVFGYPREKDAARLGPNYSQNEFHEPKKLTPPNNGLNAISALSTLSVL